MIKEFIPEKFEIGTNYVIEASAGTGKTYNIVEIVKKLVSEGTDLNKLLIVTYTDKAAGELKSRIREELSNQVKPEEIDNASIGTIHSFCKNIIKEYCISSGKPSDLNLIDESESKDFIRQYIRTGEIFDKITELKVGMLSEGKDDSLEDKLVKKFCALLNCYYLNDDWKEEENIASLWTVYDMYPEFADNLKVMEKSTVGKLNQIPIQVNENYRKYYFYNWDGRSIKASKAMSEIEKEAFARLSQAKKDFNANKENSTINKLVFDHISDLYKKWQEEKVRNNEQTFNDMIRTVREEVVNDRPLLKAIRNKYQYAIIDEFQDTNQKQWDIFKKVFMTEGHNIIVVGDPKQSIYAFQGADLTVYNKAITEIINNDGVETALTKNFRSTENIIDAVNHFFENKDALAGFSNDIESETFPESSCGNTNFKVTYDGKSSIKPFGIFDVSSGNAEDYAHVVAQTIADYCSFVDDEHTKLRITDKDGKERNVCFSDFAVLSRVRSEMQPIASEFEKCGIPYTKYKDGELFAGQECASWVVLLDALDTADFSGRNRKKFRKAMFTEFFGYTMPEIRSTYFDRDDTEEIILFEKWRELVKKSAWEDLIDAIILDTDIRNKLGSLKDIKTLGTMLQLGDYCIDYLSEGNNIQTLIKNLKKNAEHQNDEQGPENVGIIAKSTDFNCVKIMTIHASKGLEFPVVISASGFKNSRKSSDLYNYHINEKFVLYHSSNKLNKEENFREWQRLFYVAYTRAKYILILPKCETLKENYAFVANSISTFMENHKDYCEELQNSGISIEDLKSVVKEILAKNKQKPTGLTTTEEDQKTELKRIISEKSIHSSYKHAYSSLSHSKEKKDSISEIETIVDNSEDVIEQGLAEYDEKAKAISCEYNAALPPDALSEDYPKGAGLGNALHEIFEVIDYKKENNDNLSELISQCFERQGFKVKSEWITDTDRMIKNVTGAQLPIIHGGNAADGNIFLQDIGFSDRKNEVEFNFNKEGQRLKNYFNGFIDLVFRKDGYYSILDWKSDRLSDEFISYSDGETIKKHVDKCYSIQRVLYSYTLIKWLKNFYPEMGEDEIFNKHFGGVYYVFLRGCNTGTGNGIYAQTWESYAELKAAYDKIVSEKVKG